MREVAQTCPQADIYVIAHSEGTVVAFLGLMKGLKDPEAEPWIKKVRGFMTIGSPIDKHMILWPELWEDYEVGRLAKQAWKPRRDDQDPRNDTRIKWRNYYDVGDPIAFELDTARAWLKEHGWDDYFQFDASNDPGKNHDIGFTRYP